MGERGWWRVRLKGGRRKGMAEGEVEGRGERGEVAEGEVEGRGREG